jgi:hypothetical protein
LIENQVRPFNPSTLRPFDKLRVHNKLRTFSPSAGSGLSANPINLPKLKAMDTNQDYWDYIIRCADGSYYTGSTHDLEQRLRAHGGWESSTIYNTPPAVISGLFGKTSKYEGRSWT